MWCSKMAARWRGKEVDLNADNGDFLSVNTSNELLMNRGDEGVDMDSQSCTDHSILSIFDDPTVASEGKSGVEEENESLLSALTEMLDSVEDDDGTLSPFDVLPDTKLLISSGSRDISVVNLLSGRATPGPKSPNTIFTSQRGRKKEDEDNIQCNSLPHMLTQQTPTVYHSKTEKVEKEVEVFTSTSLVNLVKLMHPYCLRLHVEEEEESTQRKNCTLFTQGEVWRYERPSEESDEEINVVSDDDEEPVKETKRKGERDDGRFLKSVLVNGNSPRAPPSRKKKRVSFGTIQVASFNTSEKETLNETNDTGEAVSLPPNSPQALVNSAGPALEHQTTCSEEKCDKEDAVPPKCETKAKSLSLQQYRQLRQRRQPLVEKEGNNATKWPSVPEPPTELTPILCFVGQKQNSCGQKTAQHQSPDSSSTHQQQQHKPGNKTLSHHAPRSLRPSSSQAKASTAPNCTRLKRPRPESKSLSPDSPLPDASAQPHVKIPKSIKHPVKKPSLVSSDPPNPVLVPLPLCQTASPATALLSPESKVESIILDSESSTPSEKPKQESSTSSLQKLPSTSEPKPQLLLVKQHSPNLLQDSRTKIVSGVSSRCPPPPPPQPLCPPAMTQTLSDSEKTELEPKTPPSPSAVTMKQIRCSSSTPTSPTHAPIQRKRAVSSPEETLASLQVDCPAQCAISDSGIVATDLTSLLEQFEETQAKESRVCENAIGATPASRLQTDGRLALQGNLSVASLQQTSRISTTSSGESLELESLRNPPQLKPLERVDIPEPLGTEIILSTQQGQHAKRKTSTSKAIQIIDPRPLPFRKTHVSTSEPPPPPPPHVYLSICADHDYCGSVAHSLTAATQRSRTKPSPLKDVSKITHQFQVNSLDSGTAAAAVAACKTQTSTGHTKCVTQHDSEQPTARSKTNSFTEEKALHFSECAAAAAAATEDESEDKAAPYTLPTPPPSPPNRGRQRRRYQRRSSRSDSGSSSHCSSCSSSSSSSSSSTSRSPKRRRLHPRRSESSSCSSSPCRSISRSPPRRYRLARSRSTCSRSRSRSWSQSRSPSRSRSPSPRVCLRRWKDVYSSKESRRLRREHEMRIQKLKAIDERRVVYVGRIGRSMTHDELRERFSQFGEVECVSLHFRDRGDHYGFVTFYNMDDAFAAIDNGYKLRKPDELPFDLCFGGRRQFCNSNYADLDASRDAETSAAVNRFKDVDFDSLLKQAQRGLNT